MRRKANTGSIYDHILSDYRASDIFTDRDTPRRIFWKEYDKLKGELTDPDSDDVPPHVLLYYGISGIGKTRLLKEIGKELDRKHEESGRKTSYRWVMYDFTDFGNTKEDVIKGLAHLLSQKYGFKFPMTALAETKIADEIGRKPDMELPTIEEKIRSSKIGNTILNVIKFTPFGDIAENILEGVETIEDLFDFRLLEKLNPWFMLPLGKSLVEYIHHSDLRTVRSNLETAFIFDLDNNLEKVPDEPLVIMLDTYERYTHVDDDTPARGYIKDLWLRRHDGVIASVAGLLWVIAGREKLGEIEETKNPDSWNALCISEHLVGNLAPSDIRSYLNEVGIMDNDLQDHLVELTGGVPLLLDIARETFVSLKGDPIKQVDPAMYGHNKEELVVRALDNMGKAFAKLSTTFSIIDGGWTDDMVAEIHGFLPGWDDEIYAQMKRHSMIRLDTETNRYSMHPVIKDILSTQSSIMQHTKDEINDAVFGYRLQHGDFDMLTSADTVSLIRMSFSNISLADTFYDEYMENVIFSHIATDDDDYLDSIFGTYRVALKNAIGMDGLQNKLIIAEAASELSKGFSKEALEAARNAYNNLQKQYGKQSEAFHRTAMAYGSVLLYSGQYIAARNTFRNLLDCVDENIPFFVLYGLARAYIELRDYKNAIDASDMAYTSAQKDGNNLETAEALILKLISLSGRNRREEAMALVNVLWKNRKSFTSSVLGDAYAATIYAAAICDDKELVNSCYRSLLKDIGNPASLPIDTLRNILEAVIKAWQYISDYDASLRIEKLYTLIIKRHGYMNASALKATIAYAGFQWGDSNKTRRKLLEDILEPARLIFGKHSLEVADILYKLSKMLSNNERDYRQELRDEASDIYSRFRTSLPLDEYKHLFNKALCAGNLSKAFDELLNIYLIDDPGNIAADCTDDLYRAIKAEKDSQSEKSYDDCYYHDNPYENIANRQHPPKAISEAEAAVIISGLDDRVDYKAWEKDLRNRLRDYFNIREDLETTSVGKYIRKLSRSSEYDKLERLFNPLRNTSEWVMAVENIASSLPETDDSKTGKLLSLLSRDDYETVLRTCLRNHNEKNAHRLIALGASPAGIPLNDFLSAGFPFSEAIPLLDQGAVIDGTDNLQDAIRYSDNPDSVRLLFDRVGATPSGIPLVDFLSVGFPFTESISLMEKGATIRNSREIAEVIRQSADEKSLLMLFTRFSSSLPAFDRGSTIEAIQKRYSIDMISYCINHGYNIENDSESYQLIIEAYKADRNTDFIEGLVKIGADPLSYRNDSCYSPLSGSAYKEYNPFDSWIFHSCYSISSKDCNTLLLAEFLKEKPDMDIIRQLIDDGADINGESEIDELPIISALISRGISVSNLDLLLFYGADVNTKTFYDSALIVALECNAPKEIIKRLLEANADISQYIPFYLEDYDDISYEDFVEKKLHEEGYDMSFDNFEYEVYERKADDAFYDERFSDLASQFQSEWYEITEYQSIYYPITALIFAIHADSDPAIVELLIKAGHDINMDYANEESKLELQTTGAEGNLSRQKVSIAPLAYAVMMGRDDIAKVIFDHGGRVKNIEEESFEKTKKDILVMYAGYRGWKEAIE